MSMNREHVERAIRAAHEAGEPADLSDATLRGANLSGADLRGATLSGATLSRANLRDANLRYANLSYANLRYANLRYANLRYANLSGARGPVASITGLPSGHTIIVATPAGWRMRVGCWEGTPDELRALVSQDEGWPEAQGEEVARRRPSLLAALALADAIMGLHPTAVADLAARWNTTQED